MVVVQELTDENRRSWAGQMLLCGHRRMWEETIWGGGRRQVTAGGDGPLRAPAGPAPT